MANQTARQKVIAARTDLVLEQPFFGVLALKLTLVEDETCDTAWTDGRSIGYSPAFVESLTKDQLLGVIVHEVLHCANGHPWRRDNRDPLQWNIACDYAINYVIEEAKFKLPESRLRSEEYDGKSAEWIHARLPKPKQQKPQQGGSGQSGQSGKGKGKQPQPGTGACDVRDAPGGSKDGGDAGVSEADWQQAVQQAALAAKAAGKLPASLDRFAKSAIQPRVDWRSVLRRFMQASARADYTWARPNVRYIAQGLYLPALHSEAMGVICIGVDTSGSVDTVTLGLFEAEVQAICGEMKPERTYVIYCDAKVHRVDVFERDDVVTLKHIGGGGTAFAPALDKAEDLDDEPVCMVYLTDRYGPDRPTPPAFPILWASIGDQTAPYGEVVSLQNV